MDFFRSMSVFMDQPWLAIVPGMALWGAGAIVRSKLAKGTGLAWLGYCVYEYAMKLRLLCSGECNIRVDLLLIYPLLVAAALAGVIAAARAAIGDGTPEAGATHKDEGPDTR